jgi:Ca-activated chloride channel homolog
MAFADPWVLWVAAPLLVLWLVQLVRVQRRSSASLRFSSTSGMKKLPPSRTVVLRRIVELSRVAVLALFALGMARPQTGRHETKITTDGIDIMLVMDASGSMQALDLDSHKPIAERRNRLAVVKDVVELFLKERAGDQIGMVVFGSQAFTQCPLTLDHGIVAGFLDRVEIGVAGDATAIGDGIGAAVKRLQSSKAKSRVVILLTDGSQNAGTLDPRQAAEVAKTLGVKIYTIGAGTRGDAPFLVDTVFGQSVVRKRVEIDEATLRAVAEISGGQYFRAEDAGGLEKVYKEIDTLERSAIESHTYMEFDDRFEWFVVPGLGLLLLEIGLLGTRLRKLP